MQRTRLFNMNLSFFQNTVKIYFLSYSKSRKTRSNAEEKERQAKDRTVQILKQVSKLILQKGRIAVLSPLAAANGFVLSWSPSDIWFLRPTWISPSNGILIGWAVISQLTRMPNTQTHRQTTLRATSVAIGRILCTAYRRCGLKMKHANKYTSVIGDWRISTHADPSIHTPRQLDRHVNHKSLEASHCNKAALAESFDIGLLREQSSPKWEIPCLGRRWTAL